MASSEQLLSSLFSKGTGAVNDFGSSGKGALDQVTKYLQSLFTGNRADVMKAAGPQANEVRAAGDAAKKEKAATGTSRTGGDVAGNQQIEDEVRKQIDTIIGNIQGQATGQLATIGEAEINSMLSALGITTGAVGADVQSQREASAAMWSALIGGAGKIIGAAI
jgi:hypothetical protein